MKNIFFILNLFVSLLFISCSVTPSYDDELKSNNLSSSGNNLILKETKIGSLGGKYSIYDAVKVQGKNEIFFYGKRGVDSTLHYVLGKFDLEGNYIWELDLDTSIVMINDIEVVNNAILIVGYSDKLFFKKMEDNVLSDIDLSLTGVDNSVKVITDIKFQNDSLYLLSNNFWFIGKLANNKITGAKISISNEIINFSKILNVSYLHDTTFVLLSGSNAAIGAGIYYYKFWNDSSKQVWKNGSWEYISTAGYFNNASVFYKNNVYTAAYGNNIDKYVDKNGAAYYVGVLKSMDMTGNINWITKTSVDADYHNIYPTCIDDYNNNLLLAGEYNYYISELNQKLSYASVQTVDFTGKIIKTFLLGDSKSRSRFRKFIVIDENIYFLGLTGRQYSTDNGFDKFLYNYDSYYGWFVKCNINELLK